jgi:hypothetical protein
MKKLFLVGVIASVLLPIAMMWMVNPCYASRTSTNGTYIQANYHPITVEIPLWGRLRFSSAGEYDLSVYSNKKLYESIGYCVEPTQKIDNNKTYPFEFRSLSSLPYQYTQGAWLLVNFAPGLDKSSWYLNMNATIDVARAAVQLAVWEVLFEKSNTLTLTRLTKRPPGYVNTFWVEAKTTESRAARNLANWLLTQLPSQIDPESLAHVKVAHNSAKQDLIVITPVPIPPTVLLLGSGLLGLLGYGVRRQQRQS